MAGPQTLIRGLRKNPSVAKHHGIEKGKPENNQPIEGKNRPHTTPLFFPFKTNYELYLGGDQYEKRSAQRVF
jgi:hypothetical protein